MINRRNFLRLSTLGLGSLAALYMTGKYKTVLLQYIDKAINAQADFQIPGAQGQAFKFAAIGDCHGNYNILRGMLQHCVEHGVSDVFLIGDQADELKPSLYKRDWGGQHNHYVEAVKEFTNKLNLYPTRGNHEGLYHQADKHLYVNTKGYARYQGFKDLWGNTIGTLLKNQTLFKPNYLDANGKKLDCCGTYAFLRRNTLFVCFDGFFNTLWGQANGDKSSIDPSKKHDLSYLDKINGNELPFTTLHNGLKVKAAELWLVLIDFLKQSIKHFDGKFEHLIVFNHHPLVGRNHNGQLEFDNEALSKNLWKLDGSSHIYDFQWLEENGHKDITKEFIALLNKHHGIYLAGHDHAFAKGNVYATNYKDAFYDFKPYADSSKNSGNANGLSYNLPQAICAKHIIVDSSSHKHYSSLRAYERNFEVPLACQNTNSKNNYINAFLIAEIRGGLISLNIIGTSHKWKKDNYCNVYLRNGAASSKKIHQLNNSWQLISTTNIFSQQTKSFIVPANYDYATYIPPSKAKGLMGTSARIVDGKNTTFNSIKSKNGQVQCDYAEELNFMWLKSKNKILLSDVLFIDGMVEQEGVCFDENGNIKTEGKTWHINPNNLKSDTYTLAFALHNLNQNDVKLARFNEERNKWMPLPSKVKGNEIQALTNSNGFFALIKA